MKRCIPGFFLATLLTGSAHAQTILNGDFETGDLTGWTNNSSDFCYGWCEDGWAGVINEGDAGVGFPSPSNGLALITGDQEGGFNPTWGEAASDAFLVTRDEINWMQFADDNSQFLWVGVFHDGSGNLAAEREPSPSVDTWSQGGVDVDAVCGEMATIEIYSELSGFSWGANLTLWDDFVQAGDACPDFVDEDGDGWCVGGQDLDGNGDCADDGEPNLQSSDCDDEDASIHPGAEDIGGDGIDQNCDGVDADATGTTTGTPGTGTSTGTGTGTGTNTGTSTGIGPGAGGSDDPSATDTALLGQGAGCACNQSSPLSGAAWLVLLAAIRRRR